MCVDDPAGARPAVRRARQRRRSGRPARRSTRRAPRSSAPTAGPRRAATPFASACEGLLAMAPEITPTSSRAVMAGDIALMSNRWRMSLGGDDGAPTGLDGASTEVARRQPDGGWLYVIDNPSLGSHATAAGDGAPRVLRRRGSSNCCYEAARSGRPHHAEPAGASQRALDAALRRAGQRLRARPALETAKVLVIQGAGATFCAGDDITEMALWGDANQVMRRVRGYQRMADALADLDKITDQRGRRLRRRRRPRDHDGVRLRGRDTARQVGHAGGRRRDHAGMGWDHAHGAPDRTAHGQGDQPARRACTRRAEPRASGCGTASSTTTASTPRSKRSCRCCCRRTSRPCGS